MPATRCAEPSPSEQDDRISSPLTYGILHPVILLPRQNLSLPQETLDCILTHEYVHIRRFDCLLKLLLTAALCLHWLNPLVWVMYLLANRDIELCCDEVFSSAWDWKSARSMR